ncbi:INO80 complex subunit E [Glossina fuscipes]|uniref:INO80 complex subunit E n=2 Tax=Nemorhina TaxID=44051 RepID=A0A9C5Z8I5_9MUSC|nr:INO80 complex subunit E [Glossina fuscipes]
MLDGWYCRTLANEQATASQQNDHTDPNEENDDTESDSQYNDGIQPRSSNAAVDYKAQYRYLKKKLKFLIYENEFFQDALRSNQRRLLKVSRDRAFLLDRLLQYEKPENSSSESDETEESSEDDITKETKRRKLEPNANGTTVGSTRGRKKKVVLPPTNNDVNIEKSTAASQQSDEPLPQRQQLITTQHISSSELERQLSKRPIMDMIPERAPATVPVEMFSNEPSLDSEPNEQLIDGGSPTHVAAEECVPMEYSN